MRPLLKCAIVMLGYQKCPGMGEHIKFVSLDALKLLEKLEPKGPKHPITHCITTHFPHTNPYLLTSLHLHHIKRTWSPSRTWAASFSA